jgi:hypothetical protein
MHIPESIPADQIRIVCYQCHAHVGGAPTAPFVSHGLCGPCFLTAMAQMDAEAVPA